MTRNQYKSIKELIWGVGLMIIAMTSDNNFLFFFAAALSLISLVLHGVADRRVDDDFLKDEFNG